MSKLSYKTLLIIFFSLLIGIVILWKFVLPNHKVEASWWNDGWNYRKAISISNTSGSNLTDFQMSISIGTSALIASGKMQSDCDDIRITDINGNLLPYWIEENNPGCNQLTDTKIWIKANSLPTSGTTIFIYYGNSSAPTASSGASTFIYFKNNFQTTDLGWNWSNGGVENGWAKTWANSYDSPGSTMTWLQNIINITGQEVVAEFTVKLIKLTSTSHNTTNVVFNPTATTGLYTNTASSNIANSSGNSLITFGDYATWYGKVGFDSGYGQGNNITNDTNYPKYAFNTDGWVRHVHKLTNSSLLLSGYSLGGLDIGGSAWTYNEKTVTSGYTKPNTIILAIGEHTYDSTYLREVFIRKYASVEPTATLQSEEAGGGPVAYWKFDEGNGTTTYDSSSNKFNGAFIGTGTSAPTWVSEDQCISGKCLSFSGISEAIRIPYYQPLHPDIFSINMWVKLNQYSSNTNVGYILADNYGSLQDFIFYISNTGLLALRPHSGTDQKSNTTIPLHKWTHVSATYDGSTIKLYINGKYSGGGNSTGIVHSTSSTFVIGGHGQSGWEDARLNGFIDEPKIYSYARTAAQIKKDYNSRGSSKGTSANLGGAGSDNNLSNGLVGYWKMDEGVGTSTADSSGNSNTGTLNNAGWMNGKYGIGTSFNGTSSTISIVHNSVLKPSSYISISTWIKPIDITSTSYSEIYRKEDGNDRHLLSFQNNGTILSFGIGTATQGYQELDVSITASDYTNGWHLITAVYDGQKKYLYKDGILIGSQVATGALGTSGTATAYIGSYLGTLEFFNGLIDEVRIYNRALSPSEVTQLYEYAPEPVGYWDFEENTGTTIKDKSGNGNTGNLYNSPTWTQGKIGSAIDLNGTNQYADITTSSSAIQGYGTFEIWFKPNNCSAANQSIFSQRYNSWHGRGIIISSNTISGWSRNGSATWQSVTLGSCVNNQWYHAVLTQEGNIIKGYLNGVFISSLDMTSSLDGSYLNYYTIGKYTNDSYFFDGTIDDVKIYNYARTQKQIIEDMNAGAPASSNKSPIAYWKFDEGSGTTTNNSGNGGSTFNTTFATGSSAPTWTNDGKSGKALNFDGVGNYALANSDPAYNLQEMTISAWVKADSVDKTGPIVGNAFGWWYRYGIFISGGTYTAFFRSTGGTWTLSSSVSSSPNNWDYVAVSYKDGTAKIYVNGKLRNSGIFTYAPLTQSSSTIMFGTHSISANDWFKGSLDEVKIYNYALTDEEVKQDYNQGSALQMGQTSQTISGTTTNLEYCIPGDTSPCASPVAEWNFEENTGTTTKDSSGNNNTGTLINSPTWTVGQNNKGTGLKFNGTNRVDLSSNPQNGATAGSWSFWAKWDTDPTSVYQNIYIQENSVWIAHYAGNLGIDISNGSWYDGSGGHTTGTTLPPNSFTDLKWHHVEWTFDGNYVRGYLDGQLKVGPISTGSVHSINNGSTPRDIGSRGTAQYLNGKIDQFKIYNYARTPAQVAYDYNKGGPIGWWKFDECQGGTAYDSSGIGNTGVIVIGSSGTQNSLGTCQSGTSAAWTNGASGHTNGSLNFDGTDDVVNIADKDLFTFSTVNFSASAWVYLNTIDLSSNEKIIVAKTDYGNNQREWALGIVRPSSSLCLNSIGGGYGFWSVPTLDISNPWIGVCNTTTPELHKWHHITGTISNGTGKLYIDGKLVNTRTGMYTTMSNGTANLTIGGVSSGGSPLQNLDGQIDDVRIYNYALTPEQVKTLYNGGAVSFN